MSDESKTRWTAEDVQEALNKTSLKTFLEEYEVPYQPERDPQRGFRLPYIKPENRNPAWSDEALTAKGLELDVKSISRLYLLPE